MTKTITIQSKHKHLHNTLDDIRLGRYTYTPASSAVKAFIEATFIFNDNLDSNLTIELIVKYVETEQAKIKLKGKRNSIRTFLNGLIAETNILEKFEIQF